MIELELFAFRSLKNFAPYLLAKPCTVRTDKQESGMPLKIDSSPTGQIEGSPFESAKDEVFAFFDRRREVEDEKNLEDTV